ncbi:MAG TPA: T9SS type A sorting domain-containing protein [Flavitalea sp.]|nr:T9SS type A sorting domain-containing protein [Flavitalea sp.]
MKKISFVLVAVVICISSMAQLFVQENAGLHIQQHAILQVQGELSIYDPVSGEGKLELSGSSRQEITSNGQVVNNLFVNNAAGVDLIGDLAINQTLVIDRGNLYAGNYTLTLNEEASATGSSYGFIENGDLGNIEKKLNHDLVDFILPLGNGSNYIPVILNSQGSYTHSSVKFRSVPRSSSHLPPNAENYLGHYWLVTREGIKGKVQAGAATDHLNWIKTNNEPIRAMYWADNNWHHSAINGKNGLSTNLITEIPEGEMELSAMSNFTIGRSKPSLSVFPNPATNRTTVQVNTPTGSKGSLQLFDATGKLIESREVTNMPGLNIIPLSLVNLPKGAYHIRIRTADFTQTKAVIKQ